MSTSSDTFPTPQDIERIQEGANAIALTHLEPIKKACEAMNMFSDHLNQQYHGAARLKMLRRREAASPHIDKKHTSYWSDRHRNSQPGDLTVSEFCTPEERHRLQRYSDDYVRLFQDMSKEVHAFVTRSGLEVRRLDPFEEPDMEQAPSPGAPPSPSHIGRKIVQRTEETILDAIKAAEHTVDTDTRKHAATLSRAFHVLGNDIDLGL
jgi:hypothetical protein